MKVNPESEPVVTAFAVKSTVAGEQTAAGFKIDTTGAELKDTTTGLIDEQPLELIPLI